MISLVVSILIAYVLWLVLKDFIGSLEFNDQVKHVFLLLVSILLIAWVFGLFGVFPEGSRIYYWGHR